TPYAAASWASTASTSVTREVLPDPRLAMRPRLSRLDLCCEPQERHLVARSTDEHDADRQVVIRPVQRDVHGGLATHVVRRGERCVALLVLEVLRRVVVVAQPADKCGR